MTAVLFDFNGTLLFDTPLQERAWQQYLRATTHRHFTNEELQHHVYGRNAQEIFRYVTQKEFSMEEIFLMEEEKEQIYRAMCLQDPAFHLAQGAEAFLDRLVQEGIPRTIATASARPNTRFFYEQLHLERWFSWQDIIYNDGSFKGKPAPDIYLLAAQVLHQDIHDCIIFEDSYSGIQAAKNAEAKIVIGVASQLEPQILIQAGADRVIHDYTELLSL